MSARQVIFFFSFFFSFLIIGLATQFSFRFVILWHFQVRGKGTGKEGEGVTVIWRMVILWLRTVCSCSSTAPLLGEYLQDWFRTAWPSNCSLLLEFFTFSSRAKHWSRVLYTAPLKLRCGCRHRLSRCVKVDAALGKSCASYVPFFM